MAKLSHEVRLMSDGTVEVVGFQPAPSPTTGKIWRVNHDKVLWRSNVPEVFRVLPLENVVLTEALQWLWRNINPQLTGTQWARMLGNSLAFTNGHGFPGHHDYINDNDADKTDPVMEFMRVCGGALLKEKRVVGNQVYFEGIDVHKPLPTAQEVLDHGWYFEAVNVDWSVSTKSIIIRPFKGNWGVPCYIPLFQSAEAYMLTSDLTEVDMTKPLPSVYQYP